VLHDHQAVPDDQEEVCQVFHGVPPFFSSRQVFLTSGRSLPAGSIYTAQKAPASPPGAYCLFTGFPQTAGHSLYSGNCHANPHRIRTRNYAHYAIDIIAILFRHGYMKCGLAWQFPEEREFTYRLRISANIV
jgi:hypothetical protein